MGRAGLRGVFSLTVALCAATTADPLVEAASNAGWFGPGSFTDHSSLDLIPASIASAFLAGLCVFFLSRPLVRSRSLAFARDLRDSLGGSSRSILTMLPAIVAAELAVLFGMETLEQMVVAGHPLGGTIWLGGPVAFALAAHAAISAVAAFALLRILTFLTVTVVDFARFIRGVVVDAHRRPVPLRRSNTEPIRLRRKNLLASRSGKRAPPLLSA